MTSSRILVTGATGRVGANIVKSLVEEGFFVKSFVIRGDPNEKKLASLDTEIVYGDLINASGILDAVEGIDVIIHAASLMGQPKGVTRQQLFDINTRGTFALFDAAVATGTLKRIIFISSTSVYDTLTVNEFPATECAPTRPLSLYGITKILSERMALDFQYQYDIPVIILRPNFIQACDEILNGWTAGYTINRLKMIQNNKKAVAFVDGLVAPWEIVESVAESTKQLFIPRGPAGESWCEHRTDVRDMVQAVLLSLRTEKGIGEIFNICGPEPVYRDKVIPYLAQRLGETYSESKLPILFRYCFSNEKAEKLLGYRPQYDPIKMIESAFEYREGKDIGVIPATVD